MRHLFIFITFPFFTLFTWSQDTFMYVSDAGNWSSPPWQILRYNIDGSDPHVFINDSLAWPQDILFIEDSNFVLISNLNSGKINRHDADTGDFLSTFAEGLGGPTRMKIGPDGYLYVLQWTGDFHVKRFDLAGNFIDDFTSVGVPQSIGMVWDEEGNLYVSSFSGKNVRKFDSSGTDLGLFIDSDLAGPTNIWFDNNGDMLVSDYSGSAIKRFDSEGEFVDNYISGLSQSEGIDTLANGNLLVGNGGTSAIKMYDPDGVYIEDVVSSGSGGLMRPNAVVVRTVASSSINEETGIRLMISPNSGEIFNIKIKNFSPDMNLSITDLSGKEIERLDTRAEQQYNAQHLPQGTYMIRFQTNDRSFTQKIIVIH